MKSGECLVARSSQDIQGESAELVGKLGNLTIGEAELAAHKKKEPPAVEKIPKSAPSSRLSPAEFFQLQSLKTSALAGRTKTTTKFGGTGPEVYNVLLSKADTSEQSEEKENDNKKDSSPQESTSEDSSELIGRGPIRGATKSGFTYPYPQPYHPTGAYRQDLVGQVPYGTQSYGYAPYPPSLCSYQNGLLIEDKSEPWQAVAPVERVSPESASYQQVPQAALVDPSSALDNINDQLLTDDDLNRILEVPNELPEALSDFILKYSRRYSVSSVDRHSVDSGRSSSRKSSFDSAGSSPRHLVACRALSADDNTCDSPMSAGSAPRASPSAPNEGQTPGTPTGIPKQAANNGNKQKYKTIVAKLKPGNAKERLRSLFSDKQMDEAWAWTAKCTQSCPGALFYRDADGDSLLHIVVWHRDLPKVYALVEQMQSKELPSSCHKPFDMPNRVNETPLFLAVEKRAEELVSYLLEVGANPNAQTARPDGDAALHYAAARGMTEIVQALCACAVTNLNGPNAFGLTPLLCAVKNHGVIEEDSQCLVNNKPTIRALVKAGADAKLADATNGKTVLHYAVERMDPELVEIFRSNLDPDSMAQLTNISCFNGETPVQLLNRLGAGMRTGLGRMEAEDELRRKMFLTLLTCGAEVADQDEMPKLGLDD